MKIAIVGSRNLKITSFQEFLPSDVTEIVSGGAKGIDSCAEKYARENGLRVTVFYPDYEKYGKKAPLLRNHDIVKYADAVYAFWDGESRGTYYTIELAKTYCKPVRVFIKTENGFTESLTTFTLL